MQDLIFSIGGFILAIGILVTVHEYGHYLAARLCNVKVLRFSVGFGKPLWSKVCGKDQTEYVLAAIPLGGYVKMLDEIESEVGANEKHRAFNNQSLLNRSIIVSAGPIANFLFAIVAYALVNILGQQGLEPVVEYVKEDSYAQQAGFQSADRILSIDGREHRHWDDNRLYLLNRALTKSNTDFEVESSGGNITTITVDFSRLDNWQPSEALLESVLGLYPLNPQIEAIIGSISPDSPASRAGLEVDDRIVSIDELPMTGWRDLVAYVSSRPGQNINITVERGQGSLVTLNVNIQPKEVNGAEIGRIGIGNKPVDIPEQKIIDVDHSLVSAITGGFDSTWQMSTLTVRMLWKMLKLEVSPKNISGPITIAEYAGKTAQVGLNSFLLFLAVISISLGIINLLPIPMLDGGHLLMYIAEAIKGGPLSETSMIIGQKIGLLILGALMFLAFYNDLARLVQ